MRALRIGFRPVTSEQVRLTEGDNAVLDMDLDAIPMTLSSVRIMGESVCGVRAGSAGQEALVVWEQARAALTATLLSRELATGTSVRIFYDRVFDASGRQQLGEDARVVAGRADDIWTAAPAQSLKDVGYVIETDDDIVFRAPGIELLASDSFVADHCFRITKAGRRVGVTFEPARTRRRVPDIAGTLWLETASAELRSLEYRYTNLRREISDAGAGGSAEFARLANGSWVITSWAIRMPIIELRRDPTLPGRASSSELRPAVRSLKVTGGMLTLVTAGSGVRDTLWAAPKMAVQGVIIDSASGNPLAGADVRLSESPGHAATTDAKGQFTLSDVIPGSYHIRIRTPSLDSVNSVHAVPLLLMERVDRVRIRVPDASQVGRLLCRGPLDSAASRQGMVFGTVIAAAGGGPAANALVRAEWVGDDGVRWMEARSGTDGGFRFCGVPVNRTIAVQAATDRAASLPVAATILGTRRIARTDVVLDPELRPTASLVGVVVADSIARQPLAGAEILIAELGRSERSDSRGAFRLRDIPPGTYEVIVRRPGFGAASAQMTFLPNAIVQRRVVLTAMTTLNDVLIRAERPDPVIRRFEENRQLGLGQFITRADLARYDGVLRLGDVLSGLKAAQLFSQGTAAWLSSTRGRSSVDKRCTPLEEAHPDGRRFVSVNGAVSDCNSCYPVVYLDRTLIFNGGPGSVAPNINKFAVEQVEAVEYYAGAAQVPTEYSGLNTHCGVLVIHTRR